MGDRDFSILIVDDTEDILDLLRMRLQAEGYACLTAPNGTLALEMARRAQPDLILLDVMMPDMDGYEVLERLKETVATRRIPVIFLTARAGIMDRVQGLTRGAVDYVSKPFDARELLARVEIALRTKRAMDSLEHANNELRASSVTDPLTSLYNRRYFEERLAEELVNGERSGVQAACLLLDIDHFKTVNDSYGHLGGDAVIRQFAERMYQHARKGDVVARFGGDEFAILMAGVTPRGVRAVAEKHRALIEESPFVVDGQHLRVTTSIGATCFPLGSHSDMALILEQADRALYRAKATRNRVEVVAETNARESER